MSEQEYNVKHLLSKWLGGYLYRCRLAGKTINRSDVANLLGCTPSCLSQYTNPAHPKKAPWEFQVKLSLLSGKSMLELHPELEAIRIQHF
jgi:hypothetical protein